MNGELLNVLEYLEREKGIKREVLIKAVESSLLSASRKGFSAQKNTSIAIDPKTGDIRVYNKMKVVKNVVNPKEEIGLIEAKQYQKGVKIDDEIDIEVTPKDFGRIAAQTAKQVIIQKIREAEKEIVFNEYKERQGDIVTGLVRRYERGMAIIDLGKCEAQLPQKEQTPTEKYPIGSRVRAYVLEVRDSAKALEIVLSRNNPGFLKKLFEIEVPEVGDGIVEIKGVAREAGFRSKVAVSSKSEKVDCVGACVGMRGERIKNIVRELNGERIDIVPWNSDIDVYVANALSPAKLKKVKVFDDEKKVEVLVEPDQLSLAIGRKGQNARLCAKLTGYIIDIMAERIKDEKEETSKKALNAESVYTVGEGIEEIDVNEAILLSEINGLDEIVVKSLKQTGYRTAQKLVKLPPAELSKIMGWEEKQAEEILKKVSEMIQKKKEEQK